MNPHFISKFLLL